MKAPIIRCKAIFFVRLLELVWRGEGREDPISLQLVSSFNYGKSPMDCEHFDT